MSVGVCAECGDEYAFGHDGSDPFTSFSVNQHYQDDEDFAVSVCGDCADGVVAQLREWYEAKETDQ